MSSSTYEGWTKTQTITWEEYFDVRFKEAINMTKMFMKELGKEKVYKLTAQKTYEEGKEFGKEIMEGKKTLTSVEDLSLVFRELFSTPYFKASTDVEILDDSAESFNYNVSKCIWAHTFRKYDASELGYHMICFGDNGIAKGLSPNVKLVRTKTLMQGDNCCDFKWCWEEKE